MSDSSIPNDKSTKTDVVELRHGEDIRQAFQEQSEWYRMRRLRGETSLCDCSNCINARELKAADMGGSGMQPSLLALPKQPDISQWKIPL